MNLEDRIVELTPEDLIYPFHGQPYFNIKPVGSKYNQTLRIEDTFPAYKVDKKLVLVELIKCEKRFPIGFPITYYILPFEIEGRTNGAAWRNSVYGETKNGESLEFSPYIVFSAKRIPTMPSMIRYLCSHEYSHQVDNWICYKKGIKEEDPTEFDKEYALLRGIDLNNKYGGGKWHTNIGEIIANDCRICVFNAEPEFWPHEVKHPNECPEVHEFWSKMLYYYV